MLDLNYNALVKQAQTALRQKEVVLARRICDDLFKQKKKDPVVLNLLARVAIEETRNAEAVGYLEKCIALEPKKIEFHLDLGWLLSRMGKSSAAIARLEKARRLQPQHPAVIELLADVHERAGESDKARALLAPLIESGQETPAMATVWARLLLTEKKPHDAVAVLVRHENAPRVPEDFHYVLGQAHERANNLQPAFDAYCQANLRASHKFDLSEHIERYRKIIKHLTRPILQRLPKPSHDTAKPIFIAGRPRSGTTLVEKILDSHPHVAGVGELPHLPPVLDNLGFEIGSVLMYPECIRDLDQTDVNRLSKDYLDHLRRRAPDAKRTVDKNLVNYEMLGMISVLFPQSHVIHIHRNDVDNCWAIFVAAMNYAWCSDLRTLGITYALYERIMQHWRETLDLPILDIAYESLVEDQEGWTRKILEFCGLPWDDRCLRYYENAAKQKDSISAPTLSYNQVRQPIYKTAVGRAQKFEAFLGPLRAGLEEGRRIAEQQFTT